MNSCANWRGQTCWTPLMGGSKNIWTHLKGVLPIPILRNSPLASLMTFPMICKTHYNLKTDRYSNSSSVNLNFNNTCQVCNVFICIINYRMVGGQFFTCGISHNLIGEFTASVNITILLAWIVICLVN